ncbi:TetR/AcrR family transcriptional regulator [Sphaerimonospora cavernae]|uniref:TetR/AcrR family transcriptional regulator n=1 Tax=Sphaerimonospora cavernae TaxID=1740611 RepID=A0ABV6TXA2_9ACTN
MGAEEDGRQARQNVWMRPERASRGPRPGFSRAQMTEVAIRVADAEGLEAISMRRIAAEIGSGTMSLYRYISGKDDLIDLMVDAVAVEYVPSEESLTGGWRTDLRGLAVHTRAAMLRHPWTAPLSVARHNSGPNGIASMEKALRMVDGLGLSIDGMMTVIGAVAAYVSGFVQAELAQAEALRRSGLTLAEWMAGQLPFIQSVIAGGDYPLFTRMISEGGQDLVDSEDRFAYGLDRLLDGIAARLPASGGPPSGLA